ncbi:MAG: hypothetical protein WBV94_33610 [Blastocatellia bacterium]
MLFGPKICEVCGIVYTEISQLIQCPHDYREVIDDHHERRIKYLFHKLWSRDVGTPGYNKTDWKELQLLLQARRIEV